MVGGVAGCYGGRGSRVLWWEGVAGCYGGRGSRVLWWEG